MEQRKDFGMNIAIEKDVDIEKGQRLLVTLETPNVKQKIIDFDKYITTTERGRNVEKYMEEMRTGDRI